MAHPLATRAATPTDWEPTLELWQASHEVRRNGRPLATGQVLRAQKRLAEEASLLLLAEEPPDGTLVGCILAVPGRAGDGAGEPLPGLVHLTMMCVAPDHWGRQIGRGLLEAALAESARRGYDRAQLWTHADNLRANRLYRGMGFRRSGRVRIDDWGELIVHYQRPLTDADLRPPAA